MKTVLLGGPYHLEILDVDEATKTITLPSKEYGSFERFLYVGQRLVLP